MLRWTQSKQAGEAGVARKTIADFETGGRMLHRRTRVDIKTARTAPS